MTKEHGVCLHNVLKIAEPFFQVTVELASHQQCDDLYMLHILSMLGIISLLFYPTQCLCHWDFCGFTTSYLSTQSTFSCLVNIVYLPF